jgi:fatty acid-binding protein DegV
MSDRRTEVVCDTTAYLPADMVSDREIHLVSLYVGLEGELERESEISDYAEFYDFLLYTTPSPRDVEDSRDAE